MTGLWLQPRKSNEAQLGNFVVSNVLSSHPTWSGRLELSIDNNLQIDVWRAGLGFIDDDPVQFVFFILVHSPL